MLQTAVGRPARKAVFAVTLARVGRIASLIWPRRCALSPAKNARSVRNPTFPRALGMQVRKRWCRSDPRRSAFDFNPDQNSSE